MIIFLTISCVVVVYNCSSLNLCLKLGLARVEFSMNKDTNAGNAQPNADNAQENADNAEQNADIAQ